MTRASLVPVGVPILFLFLAYWGAGVLHSGALTSRHATDAMCAHSSIRIVESDPADGFADVLPQLDPLGQAVGITSIEVAFDAPVELSPACIDVLSTAESSPTVSDVEGAGAFWTVHLDRPIPAGESTAIVLFGGAASVMLRAHPGDVNLDGLTDAEDLLALVRVIGSAGALVARHDMDRNGFVDDADVERLAGILESDGEVDWSLDEPKQIFCCCHDGVCSIHIGTIGCVDGDEQVACPCTPNPCSEPPFGSP